jgi:hypothetical protein
MSQHAERRCQQRGIPPSVIDVVRQHGTPTDRPGNAIAYHLARNDCQLLIAQLKRQIHVLEKASKIVVVESDEGTVLTTYPDGNIERTKKLLKRQRVCRLSKSP